MSCRAVTQSAHEDAGAFIGLSVCLKQELDLQQLRKKGLGVLFVVSGCVSFNQAYFVHQSVIIYFFICFVSGLMPYVPICSE